MANRVGRHHSADAQAGRQQRRQRRLAGARGATQQHRHAGALLTQGARDAELLQQWRRCRGRRRRLLLLLRRVGWRWRCRRAPSAAWLPLMRPASVRMRNSDLTSVAAGGGGHQAVQHQAVKVAAVEGHHGVPAGRGGQVGGKAEGLAGRQRGTLLRDQKHLACCLVAGPWLGAHQLQRLAQQAAGVAGGRRRWRRRRMGRAGWRVGSALGQVVHLLWCHQQEGQLWDGAHRVANVRPREALKPGKGSQGCGCIMLPIERWSPALQRCNGAATGSNGSALRTLRKICKLRRGAISNAALALCARR